MAQGCHAYIVNGECVTSVLKGIEYVGNCSLTATAKYFVETKNDTGIFCEMVEECHAYSVNGGCVTSVLKGIEYDGNCSVTATGKYFVETKNDTGVFCEDWFPLQTQLGDVVLPGIVFLALCVLLFIMCFKNIRERSTILKKYRTSVQYKELEAGGEPVHSKPKHSRVPHSDFTCKGITMHFQLSSNLKSDQKPDPKPAPAPVAAVDAPGKTDV